MKPELYQEIVLKEDWEEFNLHRGDIATLIDFVPSPTGGEDGAILEVFNVRGEAIALVTVPVSSIESLGVKQQPAGDKSPAS
ncbi:DUF4926 domain-containing protein [Oscillatoria acuminata]|uniref:DUF4926 domain-containing protein n=1 Tax=Oscillatoria acuminata PCC 6304 TaxID=56110 RepID=K9TSN0_9CYAN|nr:DUF4926 domain-containing protein [Oscillatoria acuminata]AFY85413.1 hypothetical protein Oscil6304_5950 [Oscillatoria acuminata PCC 6304]